MLLACHKIRVHAAIWCRVCKVQSRSCSRRTNLIQANMQTTSDPLDNLPRSVLLILSVAQGGGDFAFCSHLYRTVRDAVKQTSALASFSIVLSFQAGRNAAGALACMLDHLSNDDCKEFQSQLYGVFDRRAGLLLDERSKPATRAVRPYDLILQGPLLVFATVDEVQDKLGVQASDSCRLVTLREFGQARFCSCGAVPGRGQQGAARQQDRRTHTHHDVSAGIDEGEVGLWNIPRPSMSAAEAFAWLRAHRLAAACPPSSTAEVAGSTCPSSHHFVAYSRTHAHAWQAGRLLACCLAWLPGTLTSMAVFTPSPAYAQSMLDAVRCHPAVRAVDQGNSSHVYSACMVLGSTNRTVELELYYLDALALPPAVFQALLATACGAVVCGDASLNEAVSYTGPLWWYSADGHKMFTDKALQRIVGAGLHSTGVVARERLLLPTLWTFLAVKETSGREAWEMHLKDASLALLQAEYRELSAYLLRHTLQQWVQKLVHGRHGLSEHYRT